MDRTFIDALATAISKGNQLECKSIIRRYKGDTYRLVAMVYYGYYSLTTQGMYNVIDSRNIDSILNCLYNNHMRSVVIDMYDGCRGHPTIIYKGRSFDKDRQLISSIRKKHYINIAVYSYKYMNNHGIDELFKTVIGYFARTIGCSNQQAVMDIWDERALSDDVDMNIIRVLSIISELLML